MLFTTHALTGAAIGMKVGHPVLGLIFGFISHFLLDAMPHFDQGGSKMKEDKGAAWLGAKYESKITLASSTDWIMLFLDMILACGLSLFILKGFNLNFWVLYIAGATGGLLPDILDVSPLWKEGFRKTFFGKKMHELHHFLHWPLSLKFWHVGLAIQLAIVLLDIYIIKNLV